MSHNPLDVKATDVAHSRPMDYDTLPDRLRRIANLADFAKKSGLHRKTLQRIMDGPNTPNLSTCRKVVEALAKHKPASKPKDPPSAAL